MSNSWEKNILDNQKSIKQLLSDLKTFKNMKDEIYLQKCEALRILYVREEDISHALGINAELRNKLNTVLENSKLPARERKNLLKKYWQTFLFAAPYDFHSYLLYMEKDRDAEKRFYQPRIKVLRTVVQDLQDLADGKLMRLALSMPPGCGKSTLGIFFIVWLMGKEPLKPSLATAYADKLTRSFFDGALQIIKDPEYKFHEIFPEASLVATNSKDETIDLKQIKRFKTLTCRSIDSGLTGATRCEVLAYADDMVSGSEEAMNRERMDILWTKFSNDFMSRMKQDCKMLIIGTRWSIHDPIGRLEQRYFDDPKSKFVKLPALNIDGNSIFDYDYGVGFSTEYFLNLKENMDDVSWRAIYMQEPIEREGLLYAEDELQYFFELPKERPDAVVAVCDSKGQGRDYVCAPCGYIYGNSVYISEVVFNNGLPEITKPLVANMCVKNKVSRMDVESNNGGDYYAKDVNEQIEKNGGSTSIRTFFTSSNKITKIVTESDYVKKHFIFLHKSKQNTDYKRFMQNLLSFTVSGKAKHDDAPDAVAMLSQLVKDLSSLSIKILERRNLPF